MAPSDESSGEGKGAEECCVMHAGQSFVMRMSISCEEEEALRMEVREAYVWFLDWDFDDDLTRVLERRRSTVWVEKKGDANPGGASAVV